MVKKESLFLVLVLLFRAFVGFVAASLMAIYLVPDEAQYWLWSQDLSLAYYSKPPGIAYEIAIGTHLFGNTEFGVRFLAVVMAGLIGSALYRTARAGGFNKKIALYAALIFCLSPIGWLGSFVATTDGGMLLFSILAFGVLLKALNRDEAPVWPLFGLFVFLAALFKWTAFLIWLPTILGLLLYPRWRTKQLIGGVLLSALSLLPSLIWNWERGFPTFLHVFYQAMPQQRSGANPGVFFLAQIALLFPIPFYFFMKVLFRKKRKPDVLSFSAYTAALILLVFLLMSFFQKVQVNWAVLFLPFASLAAAGLIRVPLLKISLLLSSVLSLALLLVPFLEKHDRTAIPYRYNFFKDAVGWDELQKILIKAPPHDFLFSNTYQMASILSFYGPGQTRAYWLNIDHRRLNHFAFLPTLKEEQLGKNGLFVRLEEKPFNQEAVASKVKEQLKPYFQKVSFIGVFPIFSSHGKAVKWVIVFECLSYNGLDIPPSPHSLL